MIRTPRTTPSTRHLRYLYYIVVIAVPLILLPATVNGKDREIKRGGQPQSQYLMRDGIVVDLSADTLYVTNPDARIEALELESGKSKWKSTVPAKPLGIVDNRLLVHIAPTGKGNTLILAEYQTSDGKELLRSTLRLPGGVNSYIRNYGKGFLDIRPYKIKDETVLAWSYYGGITRGDYDARKDDKKKFFRGAYSVGAAPGRYDRVRMANLPKNFQLDTIFVTGEKRIPREQGQQFISKDGAHILVSRKEKNHRDFYGYRWKIYDAGSKKLVGSDKSHVSYTPFFVKSGKLYRETGPYLITEGRKRQSVPLQLLAVDLKSGKTVWRKQILDTAYRGPTPP